MAKASPTPLRYLLHRIVQERYYRAASYHVVDDRYGGYNNVKELHVALEGSKHIVDAHRVHRWKLGEVHKTAQQAHDLIRSKDSTL